KTRSAAAATAGWLLLPPAPTPPGQCAAGRRGTGAGPEDGVEMPGEDGAVSALHAAARVGGVAGFGAPLEMRRIG
ncbi:unnamed protein product, partial [Urochloa humidicola]